jgi:signal transduction histidine kinase
VEKLIRISDDTLIVSEIENNRYVLIIFPLDLYDLVQRVFQEHLPLAEKKGISLTLDSSSKPNSFVSYEGDKNKLYVMLTHIIGNAIKFTESGSIKIAMGYVNNEYTITVADTGIGIANDALQELFGKFSKRQSIYNRTASAGVGVGLYIAEYIAKLHKGYINVESNIGKGSRFIIHLPAVGINK